MYGRVNPGWHVHDVPGHSRELSNDQSEEWDASLEAMGRGARRVFPDLPVLQARMLWHSGYHTRASVIGASDAELRKNVHCWTLHGGGLQLGGKGLRLIRGELSEHTPGSPCPHCGGTGWLSR